MSIVQTSVFNSAVHSFFTVNVVGRVETRSAGAILSSIGVDVYILRHYPRLFSHFTFGFSLYRLNRTFQTIGRLSYGFHMKSSRISRSLFNEREKVSNTTNGNYVDFCKTGGQSRTESRFESGSRFHPNVVEGSLST